jgi:hypothetical protein
LTSAFYEKYLKGYENSFEEELICLDIYKSYIQSRPPLKDLEEAIFTDNYVKILDFLITCEFEGKLKALFDSNKSREQLIDEYTNKIISVDNEKISFDTMIHLEKFGKYKFFKGEPELENIAERIFESYLNSMAFNGDKDLFLINYPYEGVSTVEDGYRSISFYVASMKFLLSKPYYQKYSEELTPRIEKGEKILELFKSID